MKKTLFFSIFLFACLISFAQDNHLPKYFYCTFVWNSTANGQQYQITNVYEISLFAPNYAKDPTKEGMTLQYGTYAAAKRQFSQGTISDFSVHTLDPVNNASTWMGVFLTFEQASKSAEKEAKDNHAARISLSY